MLHLEELLSPILYTTCFLLAVNHLDRAIAILVKECIVYEQLTPTLKMFFLGNIFLCNFGKYFLHHVVNINKGGSPDSS